MTNEQEQRMIEAHKRGRADYKAGKTPMPLYSAQDELDSYLAGYVGEARRTITRER